MRARKTIREQRGQTMTEFALILPILVLLLLAVIQFGIAFNNYLTVTDAARAGARKAVVSRRAANPSAAAIAAVRSSATNLDQSKLNVTVNSTWAQGSDVTVTASYPYQLSLLGVVVKAGNLTSSTTERLE
jgi:Flp pilus assembly protein TadG